MKSDSSSSSSSSSYIFLFTFLFLYRTLFFYTFFLEAALYDYEWEKFSLSPLDYDSSSFWSSSSLFYWSLCSSLSSILFLLLPGPYFFMFFLSSPFFFDLRLDWGVYFSFYFNSFSLSNLSTFISLDKSSTKQYTFFNFLKCGLSSVKINLNKIINNCNELININ